MERVGTLLQKLQQQFNSGASAGQLLFTVQMLQHELMHAQLNEPDASSKSVTVSMPLQPVVRQQEPAPELEGKPLVAEEKIIQVLQIDEKEVAAELEEIKRNAAVMQQIRGHNKPHLFFEQDEEEIPTLIHQVSNRGKEINELVAEDTGSLNESLNEHKVEISEKLTGLPVKDLRKAIGINDRFLYINDLFRGDEAMYERSIKTINSFSIWPEAEYWVRRELKTKLGWVDDNETVKQFDQLIKRRFS
jgi:hypothetical protein